MMDKIQSELNSNLKTLEKMIENLQSHIYTGCIIVNETIKNGNKILVFGNGKNAITAQHIVFNINTKNGNNLGFSLSHDACTITDIANNYGFDKVFEKQVELLAKEGDLLIGVSTSGNSKNILRALSLGRNLGCKTIGLSGCDGGAMNEFCDINLVVPSDDANRVQELHMLIGNIVF